MPREVEQGKAPAEFAMLPKDEYRRVYFEAFLDLAAISIKSRFDQEGFKTFSNLEQLLIKACRGLSIDEELEVVCTFFYDDFKKEYLQAELATFHQLYRSTVQNATSDPTCNKCHF